MGLIKGYYQHYHYLYHYRYHHPYQTAVWLAQLGERRSAEREVAGSNFGRTNAKGL